MLAALTGLVHYSQRTHGDEHNRDEDNDQGAFHNDLAPRAPHCPNFRHLEMNPVLPLRCSKIPDCHPTITRYRQ